jgi:hypothetical protein
MQPPTEGRIQLMGLQLIRSSTLLLPSASVPFIYRGLPGSGHVEMFMNRETRFLGGIRMNKDTLWVSLGHPRT